MEKGGCEHQQSFKQIRIDEYKEPGPDNYMEVEERLQLGTGGRIWESVKTQKC